MQNYIPATIYTEGGMNLSYGKDDLEKVWLLSEALQRHVGLLARSSNTFQEATTQATANFQRWMRRQGERGVTPEIDIEVFERYYDETVFRDITTAKREWEYTHTKKEPGGLLVQIDADGNYLLQTPEPAVNPYVPLPPPRPSIRDIFLRGVVLVPTNGSHWAQFSHKPMLWEGMRLSRQWKIHSQLQDCQE